MSHDEDHNDDWFDKPETQRRVEYGARKARLEKILVAVRMHRVHDCEGAPLCPGAEAAEMLQDIPPFQHGDFIATCLAALADDREEMENLRAERDQARERLAAAEQERDAAVREGDAGWEAYRQEREAHERTGRNLDDSKDLP